MWKVECILKTRNWFSRYIITWNLFHFIQGFNFIKISLLYLFLILTCQKLVRNQSVSSFCFASSSSFLRMSVSIRRKWTRQEFQVKRKNKKSTIRELYLHKRIQTARKENLFSLNMQHFDLFAQCMIILV